MYNLKSEKKQFIWSYPNNKFFSKKNLKSLLDGGRYIPIISPLSTRRPTSAPGHIPLGLRDLSRRYHDVWPANTQKSVGRIGEKKNECETAFQTFIGVRKRFPPGTRFCRIAYTSLEDDFVVILTVYAIFIIIFVWKTCFRNVEKNTNVALIASSTRRRPHLLRDLKPIERERSKTLIEEINSHSRDSSRGTLKVAACPVYLFLLYLCLHSTRVGSAACEFLKNYK